MLQIEAARARRRTDSAAAATAMQFHTPALALLALLALCGNAQARPEVSAPSDASTDASSTPTPHDASHEADVDNSSSSEEDNMTVQGKVAVLCPPRQPELLALEAECAQDDHTECSSTPAPTTEAAGDSTEAPGAAAAATTETAGAGAAGTTDAPQLASTEGTPRQGRKQRKRSCNYHLCVLKKLEVLDSSDMPDKTLLTNWIANNVTDEKQREKLQQRFTECVTSLKDIFGESSENSKSNEEETTDEKKNEDAQPKKKSCVTAKKVISCLSKSVECPVLKF